MKNLYINKSNRNVTKKRIIKFKVNKNTNTEL